LKNRTQVCCQSTSF